MNQNLTIDGDGILYCGADSGAAKEKAAEPGNPVPAAFYNVTAAQSDGQTAADYFHMLSEQIAAPVLYYEAGADAAEEMTKARRIGMRNIRALVIGCAANAAATEAADAEPADTKAADAGTADTEAAAFEAFRAARERFYQEVRRYHPAIPVIFLTEDGLPGAEAYGQAVQELCECARERGEQVFTAGVDELADIFAELQESEQYDGRLLELLRQLDGHMKILADMVGTETEDSAYEQTVSYYENGELGLSAIGKSLGAWFKYKVGKDEKKDENYSDGE